MLNCLNEKKDITSLPITIGIKIMIKISIPLIKLIQRNANQLFFGAPFGIK